jgi:NAD(P)-dependent dehydrogenase (short-subunit alcohol dehydrogenase family)
MDPVSSEFSRRGVVTGLSAGMVALASSAAAQQQSGSAAGKQAAVPDYPRPPFPEQQQPWPGLASQMNPRPDHGEKSYRGSGRLTGRKALITGGDSGMGRAAAIAFAREGADVAFGYLPAEEADAKEVVQLIRDAGRKAVPLPGDIRSEEFCTKFVNDAAAQLGGLDILVNNAARQKALPDIEQLTTDLLDWTMKTNIYATVWLTRAALKHLKAGSAIINTTSVVAYDPPEHLVDYAMTKAAVMNFTKSMAKQLAAKQIRVNGVAPGPVWTPLQPSGGQDPKKLPQFGADTPMARSGQPAELASLYVLLASREATYSTGQILGATGGAGGP